MVYLHSPRVFQSLMVLSREPETIWRLSAEKATERTSLSCPTKRRVVLPVLRSHRRSCPSHEPERAKARSVVAIDVTHPAWPFSSPRIAKLFCSEVMVE